MRLFNKLLFPTPSDSLKESSRTIDHVIYMHTYEIKMHQSTSAFRDYSAQHGVVAERAKV